MASSKEKSSDSNVEVGPMSVLNNAVKNGTHVLIACRNNKKLLALVKAFDMHFNMVLEQVTEMWTEFHKLGDTKKRIAINKHRYIHKMFLRGDSVILVVKNPRIED